jgi:putative phosphoesterase
MAEGDDRQARAAAGGGKAPAGHAEARERQRRRRSHRAATSAAASAAGPARRPRIGVISDTHGYLDPSVATLFAGVDHIIHAGDVGDASVIAALQAIAPLTVVSGNVEPDDLSAALPREVEGEVAGVRFVVAHKPKRLLKHLAAGRLAADSAGAALPDLAVCGHVHVPSALWVDGTLQLNPGTASAPDEEDDGPTVVIVEAELTGLSARFIPLRRRLADDGSPLVTRVH